MDDSDRLHYGDAVEILASLAAESVQLVVADPPYGNVLLDEAWDAVGEDGEEFLAWNLRWLRAAMRVLRPDGLLYCFGQPGKREHRFLHLVSAACREFIFHDLVIWDRVVGYNERRDSFTPGYEMILVLRKSDAPYFDKEAVREPYDARTVEMYMRDGRYKDLAARRRHLERGKFATNLWRVPSLKGTSKEKCGHPSQKPEKLIERIILSSSRAGDTVLDPFLGSGTTAVVAERCGRHWIGIERDAAYVDMATARLEKERERLGGMLCL